MASNNQNWHPAAGDSRPEYDDSRTVTYGIINGVFIRKVPITVTVYPKITDQIKELIRALEYVHELGIRRGMSIRDHTSPDSSSCGCSGSNNDKV